MENSHGIPSYSGVQATCKQRYARHKSIYFTGVMGVGVWIILLIWLIKSIHNSHNLNSLKGFTTSDYI